MMLAAFRATWRLTLRSLWLWAVTVSASVLLFLVSRGGTRGSIGLVVTFHQQGMVPLVFFLGQMFAVVTLVRQERSGRGTESLEALPYRPGARVVGQFLALYLAWLLASAALWAVGLMVQVVLPGLPLHFASLQGWLALMPASLLFATGVAYAIGSGARRLSGAYLGVVAVFFAASLMAANTWTELLSLYWRTGPATAFDVFLGAYFPLGGVAVAPDQAVLLANRAFAAAAGAAAVAWSARSLARRRHERQIGRISLVFTLAMAITLGSWAATHALWAPRLEEYLADARLYAEPGAAAPVLAGDAVPTVAAYEVKLKLQPAYHYLEATAGLDVTRAGETALFTLGHRFALTQVAGPDGQPVAYARTGDTVLVATAGNTGRYTFTYAGDVWLWRSADRSGLRTAALLSEHGAMLPSQLGWYPMPGKQVLATATASPNPAGMEITDGEVSHVAAPFHLQVEGAGDLELITNAAGGRPVTAAWLLLSEVPAIREGGMELRVTPGNRETGQWAAQRFAPELAFYSRLLPLETLPAMVEVPDQLSDPWTPIGGYPGIAVLPSSDLAVTRDGGYWFVTRTRLMTLWWGAPRNREESLAQQVLNNFLLALYRQENPGAKADPLVTEPVRELVDQLVRLDTERGREATVRLLQSFQHTERPLTTEAIAAALKGAQP